MQNKDTSSKHARDFQRQRVYDAEDAVQMEIFLLNQLTEEHCIKYATQLIRKKSVLAKYGKQLLGRSVPIGFRNSRSTTSCADGDGIDLHKGGMNDHYIIHELAHVIQFRMLGKKQFASHGPEFCQIFLNLIEAIKGKRSRKIMEESFIKHKVKF